MIKEDDTEEHEACKFPLCNSPVRAMGLCANHYKKWKKVKSVLSNVPEHGSVPYHDYHALYVMSVEGLPYCKVGRSNDPFRRRESMQPGCPLEISISGMIYGHPDVIMVLEYQTLRTLKELETHKRGEWFAIGEEDALLVAKKCADMYGLPVLSMEKYAAIAHNPDPGELLGWRAGKSDRVLATIAEARWLPARTG